MGVLQCCFLIFILAQVCLVCGRGNRHHGGEPKKNAVDPYKTLGITKDATAAQMKKAYRTLSMKWHPDKNKSPNAREMMVKINEAFEMISDPDAKMIYDEFGASEKYYDRWSYMQSKRGQELSKKDFYTNSPDVQSMEIRTFYQTVRKSPFLVEFYAPWCVHCQEMVPKFKRAAVLLDGLVSFGAVNCEKHQQLCHQQHIQSYPTLMFYHPTERGVEQEVERYEGGHSPEDIYSWIQQSLSNEVITIKNDEQFQTEVADSEHLWLIDFSAGAWCGPCTSLKSHVRKIAYSMKGIVNVGIINCDQDRDFCNQFNVEYYPQLRLFKKDRTPYEGVMLTNQNQDMMHDPAGSALSLFEKIVKLVYTPPVEAGSAGSGEGEEQEPRELDDDEIIDDVDVEDNTAKTEL